MASEHAALASKMYLLAGSTFPSRGSEGAREGNPFVAIVLIKDFFRAHLIACCQTAPDCLPACLPDGILERKPQRKCTTYERH